MVFSYFIFLNIARRSFAGQNNWSATETNERLDSRCQNHMLQREPIWTLFGETQVLRLDLGSLDLAT